MYDIIQAICNQKLIGKNKGLLLQPADCTVAFYSITYIAQVEYNKWRHRYKQQSSTQDNDVVQILVKGEFYKFIKMQTRLCIHPAVTLICTCVKTESLLNHNCALANPRYFNQYKIIKQFCKLVTGPVQNGKSNMEVIQNYGMKKMKKLIQKTLFSLNLKKIKSVTSGF